MVEATIDASPNLQASSSVVTATIAARCFAISPPGCSSTAQIETTLPKAKAVQPFVERIITTAKQGTFAAAPADRVDAQRPQDLRVGRGSRTWATSGRRNSVLRPARRENEIEFNRYGEVRKAPRLVQHVMTKVAPMFADRDGGYTRIIKLGQAPSRRRDRSRAPPVRRREEGPRDSRWHVAPSDAGGESRGVLRQGPQGSAGCDRGARGGRRRRAAGGERCRRESGRGAASSPARDSRRSDRSRQVRDQAVTPVRDRSGTLPACSRRWNSSRRMDSANWRGRRSGSPGSMADQVPRAPRARSRPSCRECRRSRRVIVQRSASVSTRSSRRWSRPSQPGTAPGRPRRWARPLDVTEPGVHLGLGRRHVLSRTIDEITEVFARMGFSVVEGPEVEDEWHNFTPSTFRRTILPATRSTTSTWRAVSCCAPRRRRCRSARWSAPSRR